MTKKQKERLEKFRLLAKNKKIDSPKEEQHLSGRVWITLNSSHSKALAPLGKTRLADKDWTIPVLVPYKRNLTKYVVPTKEVCGFLNYKL